MKTFIALLLTCLGVKAAQMRFSDFPNTNRLGNEDIFLIAKTSSVPYTNFNVRYNDLRDQLASSITITITNVTLVSSNVYTTNIYSTTIYTSNFFTTNFYSTVSVTSNLFTTNLYSTMIVTSNFYTTNIYSETIINSNFYSSGSTELDHLLVTNYVRNPFYDFTESTNIDGSKSVFQGATLSANTSFSPTNMENGTRLLIRFIEDSAGGWVPTIDNVSWIYSPTNWNTNAGGVNYVVINDHGVGNPDAMLIGTNSSSGGSIGNLVETTLTTNQTGTNFFWNPTAKALLMELPAGGAASGGIYIYSNNVQVAFLRQDGALFVDRMSFNSMTPNVLLRANDDQAVASVTLNSGLALDTSGNLSIAPSTLLDVLGSTRGSILYRGASGWAILAPATAGKVLTANGTGADPTYETPSSLSGGTANTIPRWTSSSTLGNSTITEDAAQNYVKLNPAAQITVPDGSSYPGIGFNIQTNTGIGRVGDGEVGMISRSTKIAGFADGGFGTYNGLKIYSGGVSTPTITVTSGSPTAGKIWTASDSSGNGSWQPAPTGDTTNTYNTTIVTNNYFVSGRGNTLIITNYVRFPYTILTITGTNVSTIDVSTGTHFSLTLTTNAFIPAPTGLPGTNQAQVIQIVVKQDATGGRTLGWNSAWKFAGGTVPTMTTTTNAIDVYTFASSPFDASVLMGVPAQDIK